jgi:ankyrin repeat protein
VDYKPFSVHSEGLPLVIAATHGFMDMVKLLLDHGADVNGRLEGRKFADDGLALLHAFANGHHDVVNLLLEHGARSTEHGARSTEHGARSTEHGARSRYGRLGIFQPQL